MARLAIDADTWVVLNRLLDEALDLPASERCSWLESLAPEHEVLKPQLRDLLARARDETSAILQTLPKLEASSTEGATVGTSGSPQRPGERVGPYRLTRELARGGMGVVWLAERSDGLINRPLALKLPRGAWERPALTERMAREREILATLNHPNIARLYDAGLTAEGLPYLALEFVEGRRIDEFCRKQALSLRGRLGLFVEVAKAVAHAHARLVIHRDLKPSNILVTDDGQVRLLDFGIAKLLDDGRALASDLTRASGRALTPDYASPEQIAGAAIGTASDIYSLGVVLYELLTGERPYHLERESAGAMEEAILRAEPARPSAIAAEPSLRHALRGDLDTIVLKALKKHPDERYATVNALAEDIERYLQGWPVLARPDSPMYRLSKFVRRNRLAVGAVTAVLGAVLAGAGVALAQARIALAEKERAEEVKEFIASIFRDADPYGQSGKIPNALDLLKQAKDDIDRSLGTQPELRVELLNIVGSSLLNLQDVVTAETVVGQAREAAKDALAPDDPQFLKTKLLAAKVHRFRGRTAEMRAELESLLPALRQRGDVLPEDLADALEQQAHLAIDEGDYEEAEAAAQEALAVARAKLGQHHPQTATIALVHALTYVYAKKPALAMRAADEAWRLALELYGPRHPGVIEARAVYARALVEAAKVEEAVGHLVAVLQDAASVFGPTSMMVGFFSQELGVHQLALGEIESALARMERAVTIIAQHSQLESYTYAATIGGRGWALMTARKCDAAFLDLTRAQAILAQVNGPDHERTLITRVRRALALASLGRCEEAEQELGPALEGKSSQAVHRWALHVLGVAKRLWGNPGDALRQQEEALTMIEKESVVSRDRMLVLTEIGLNQVELGQFDRAVLSLQEALGLYEQLQTQATPQRADALLALGRAFLGMGHTSDALPRLEAADAFWRGFDSENRWAGEAAFWLGRGYEALGRLEDAEQTFARAEIILARSPLPTDSKLLQLAGRD